MSHVHRKANSAAHNFAKLAFSYIRKVIYIENASHGIFDIIIAERCVHNFSLLMKCVIGFLFIFYYYFFKKKKKKKKEALLIKI